MKALFVAPYVALVRFYFRWMKVGVSRLVNLFRPKLPFQPPAFASLDEYAEWMREHLRWRADRLGGLLDVFPDLRHLAWQLKRRGIVEDDCDGLAYYSAAVVRQFVDDLKDVYIVSVVLNPRFVPLQQAAHVLCIFRVAGKWRVISNNQLYPRRYATFASALTENPYCRGKEIKFVEIRDAQLRRVHAPPGVG